MVQGQAGEAWQYARWAVSPEVLAGAEGGGLVVGPKMSLVLFWRAAPPQAKINSIALGLLVMDHQQRSATAKPA